jgi:broad specificity phosphatase PhoE
MYLLVARHGESEFNRDGRSPVDSPLTAQGRDQARRLGAWLLEHEPVDALYSSPVLRARQTAEIVGSFLQMEATYLDDLREADEYPLPHVPLQRGPLYPAASSPPDAIYQALRSRVRRAIASLLEAHHDGNVLVIAHGGSIGALFRVLWGSPATLISSDNCALHKLSWRTWEADGQAGGRWIVHYLNRRTHLDVQG